VNDLSQRGRTISLHNNKAPLRKKNRGGVALRILCEKCSEKTDFWRFKNIFGQKKRTAILSKLPFFYVKVLPKGTKSKEVLVKGTSSSDKLEYIKFS
jgi:hypothetical protein